MKMPLHSLEVRLRRVEELDKPSLINMPATIDLVSITVDASLIEDIGAYELLDFAEELGVKASSIRIVGDGLSGEGVEKLAIMAGETLTRSVIVEYRPSLDLDELFDTFSVYKSKVLLDASPHDLRGLYRRLSGYIGGVLGIALSEDRFGDTESFIDAVDTYFRLVRSITLTNLDDEGRGAPLLKPQRYNNPLAIRHIVERGYDEEITLRIRDTMDVGSEYPVFKEFLRSAVEKSLGRPLFPGRLRH